MGPEALDFLRNERIDWSRIGRAVAYYENLGYQYIEVPWIAPKDVVQDTLPKGARPFGISSPEGSLNAELVGSAEQSFLWMERCGVLQGPGRFVGVSPCFRGDLRSPIHQKTFLKVELYHSLRTVADSYWYPAALVLLSDAEYFFNDEGAETTRVDTNLGCDLFSRGIELGSYGIRHVRGTAWAYGTGLAEPRFSQALQRPPTLESVP